MIRHPDTELVFLQKCHCYKGTLNLSYTLFAFVYKDGFYSIIHSIVKVLYEGLWVFCYCRHLKQMDSTWKAVKGYYSTVYLWFAWRQLPSWHLKRKAED